MMAVRLPVRLVSSAGHVCLLRLIIVKCLLRPAWGCKGRSSLRSSAPCMDAVPVMPLGARGHRTLAVLATPSMQGAVAPCTPRGPSPRSAGAEEAGSLRLPISVPDRPSHRALAVQGRAGGGVFGASHPGRFYFRPPLRYGSHSRERASSHQDGVREAVAGAPHQDVDGPRTVLRPDRRQHRCRAWCRDALLLRGYPITFSCNSRYLNGFDGLVASGFKNLSMR